MKERTKHQGNFSLLLPLLLVCEYTFNFYVKVVVYNFLVNRVKVVVYNFLSIHFQLNLLEDENVQRNKDNHLKIILQHFLFFVLSFL